MSSHQYLELMGIDVWRERPPRGESADVPAVAEPPAPSIDQVRQSLGGPMSAEVELKVETKPDVPVAAVQPVGEAEPSFLLVFANFPNLSIASHYSADLAGIPDNHQRFLSSLQFALTAQKSTAQLFDFRWPMVKSRHISQSKEEAAAVMQQSVSRLSQQVLVFGEEAYSLFTVDQGDKHQNHEYQRTEVNGKQLWLLPELEAFFVSPQKRQQLWQFLAVLREQIRRE
jgi:hypothetical protein